MFDDVYDLAEDMHNHAKTWADPLDTSRAESLFYVAGEPELTMFGVLALEKKHGHAIPNEFLDKLLKLRDEGYFDPEDWQDERLLNLLPWFEQKRSERDTE